MPHVAQQNELKRRKHNVCCPCVLCSTMYCHPHKCTKRFFGSPNGLCVSRIKTTCPYPCIPPWGKGRIKCLEHNTSAILARHSSDLVAELKNIYIYWQTRIEPLMEIEWKNENNILAQRCSLCPHAISVSVLNELFFTLVTPVTSLMYFIRLFDSFLTTDWSLANLLMWNF